MTKRDLFAELMEGVEEMRAHREGRFEKGGNAGADSPIPEVSARELVVPHTFLHALSTVNR